MPPLLGTPKDLVEALHHRSCEARAHLRKVLYPAIDQLMVKLLREHGLAQDHGLLSRHALHSVETFLRTQKCAEFERMSWPTFHAIALVHVAKMVFPPASGQQTELVLKPDPLPECPAYESQTSFLPCEKIGDYSVGGDWFGGAAAKDGSLWVIVADVTGHGYSAYLLASNLPTVWRACWESLPTDCSQPVALLDAMHGLLADCLPEGIYVECVLARLNGDGRMTVAPAGGSRLLLRRAPPGHITMHTLRGSWLGLVPPDPADQQAWALCNDDELILASDGLFDQLGERGRSSGAFTDLLACAQCASTLFDAVDRAVGESLQEHSQKHVPHEIDEIPAVGFDQVIGEQRVAVPGHQDVGGALRAGRDRQQGLGQEGFHLGGGRLVPFEEVAALGQERRAFAAGQGSRDRLGRQRDGQV
jgi:serine phosphatase RsbU (regulator of sigma subunit)